MYYGVNPYSGTTFEDAEAAVHENDAKRLERILANYCASPEELNSLLIQSADYDCVAVAKVLTKAGADARCSNSACLRYAIEHKYPDMAMFFVEHGADVNVFDGYPLIIAAVLGQLAIAQFLVANNAKITDKVFDGIADNRAENEVVTFLRETRKAKEREEYERYKLLWMLENGYTLTDLMGALQVASETCGANNIPALFSKWERETGFSGEIWGNEDVFSKRLPSDIFR